jgi:hypothetical protein
MSRPRDYSPILALTLVLYGRPQRIDKLILARSLSVDELGAWEVGIHAICASKCKRRPLHLCIISLSLDLVLK